MQAFRESFRNRDSAKKLDLRDEAGNRLLPGRRSSPRRQTNEQALRRELAEDLASLLNTVNLESALAIGELKHVRKSIVNYGLTDLSRITIDEDKVNAIGGELHGTLTSFEPRLVAATLDIQREGSDTSARDLQVRFAVRADLHAAPLDIPIDFIAELDVDNAKLKLAKL